MHIIRKAGLFSVSLEESKKGNSFIKLSMYKKDKAEGEYNPSILLFPEQVHILARLMHEASKEIMSIDTARAQQAVNDHQSNKNEDAPF